MANIALGDSRIIRIPPEAVVVVLEQFCFMGPWGFNAMMASDAAKLAAASCGRCARLAYCIHELITGFLRTALHMCT